MRVLRWVTAKLGKGLAYVCRLGWDAFNGLKPSTRLWTIAIAIATAWLYFQSKLWDRNRQSFYEKAFEPTGDIVYAVFKVFFVIGFVAMCSWLVYGFIRYKRPQNIEDIETTSAVHEVVPLWRRIKDSRKKRGGDE